ncbi:hypothetical protein PRUPE_4G122400 [Prunus persica]|uniref:Uncharacterized protein n=1 Tax=Prunus persica TaxID=3760 RepID=A0A251PJG6_PRUPE|nr:hypothetical protein PRUPE_4G122400 [Prunus persica]
MPHLPTKVACQVATLAWSTSLSVAGTIFRKMPNLSTIKTCQPSVPRRSPGCASYRLWSRILSPSRTRTGSPTARTRSPSS